MLPRIEILERAARALDSGSLSKMMARSGVFEASKLKDFLMPLDHFEAAELCVRLESMFNNLNGGGDSAMQTVQRLRDLCSQPPGANESEQPGMRALPASPNGPRSEPYLFLIDGDDLLMERLRDEAIARGFIVSGALDLQSAMEGMNEGRPDVVVVDLVVAQHWEEMVGFFQYLHGPPAIPCIVLTSNGSQEARLAAGRMHVNRFLTKPQTPVQVMKQVELELGLATPIHTRVLAVDDDQVALTAIAGILEAHGFEVTTVYDPMRFWETLEGVQPDLVLMDVDMPNASGLELTRMVRADPRWNNLPIVFLTAVGEPELPEQLFQAGADDFTAKPMTAENLVARIRNRLDRVRAARLTGATDALTGLPGRVAAVDRLKELLVRASRKQRPVSVAVLNVDAFKDINSATDFESGDAILQRLARVLESSLHPDTLIARWVGDEFILGFYDQTREDASRVVSTLLETVRRETFGTIGGVPLHVSFSAGVAEYPTDGDSATELYRAAEMAVAELKRTRRDAVVSTAWFEDPAYAEQPLDVVIAHEDESFARRLANALRLRGFQCQWVTDGNSAASAIHSAATQKFGLVILINVDAKPLDGWGLLRDIRGDQSLHACKSIVLTANPTEQVAQEAYGTGAFAVLPSDTPFPKLIHHLRLALS
jgi:diguanylate cyclase (GGDEF)-like protein